MREAFVGEVRGFARGELPAGWSSCDGRVLDIGEHQPLFSLLGWRFGGDGQRTFGLPALRWSEGRSWVSCGIATNGFYPMKGDSRLDAAEVGEIRLFAGQQAPEGWIPCDGRMLPIAAPYLELFELIGTTYGGDAEGFAVPNLWSGEGVGRLSYIVAISGAE